MCDWADQRLCAIHHPLPPGDDVVCCVTLWEDTAPALIRGPAPCGGSAPRYVGISPAVRPLRKPPERTPRTPSTARRMKGVFVDHSHGGTTPLHRDLDPPRECRACAITQSVFRRNSGHVAEPGAEHVNSEVVVFRGPSIGGVVVVPRAHINGLEELTVLRRAKVLAALRRAGTVGAGHQPGISAQCRRGRRPSGAGASRVLSRGGGRNAFRTTTGRQIRRRVNKRSTTVLNS